MRACGTSRVVPQVVCALVLATAAARAVPGDADNAQDYPGFPRQHNFVISDYTEDNPAGADFPVSLPLPLDAAHVEMVHVRGHRFVIRYELASGNMPAVYQTQLYYEKLAAAGGFQVAKSGAVGDVSETFCRTMANHDIWVSIEPANDVNVVTVVEAPRGSTPIPGTPERVEIAPAAAPAPSSAPPPPPAPAASPTPPVVAAPAPPTAPPAPSNVVTPVPATTSAVVSGVTRVPTEPPATPPTKAAPSSVSDAKGDALYAALLAQGRVIVPMMFQPGREDLDESSQPEVDRIVAMMKKHPDLSLRVEGHTDNSGDPEDNMRLSAGRAYAVRNKIMAGNIDGKRLDAVGVGGLQPLADNSTAEGREKNRRIEIVVWKRHSHSEPAPVAGNGAQG